MKKQQRGVNSRAIRRKLGIDAKKVDEMFKNVHQLLDAEGLTDKTKSERYVNIDRHAVADALQGKLKELEVEVRKHHINADKDCAVKSKVKNKEESDIKINIS
ncbi:hypothetical protein CN918_26940 [Priestia megaterium]|nr:hypothetical protein CN918_26940 [Priestia megaterium]